MKRTLLAAAAVLLAIPAVAQVTGRVTTNASSTISVTNTFQSIAAADKYRWGCLIQNNGSNTMWVFFGPIANASKGSSVVLAAGKSVSCGSGSIVLTDQISITGTSTDAFYAGIQ